MVFQTGELACQEQKSPHNTCTVQSISETGGQLASCFTLKVPGHLFLNERGTREWQWFLINWFERKEIAIKILTLVRIYGKLKSLCLEHKYCWSCRVEVIIPNITSLSLDWVGWDLHCPGYNEFPDPYQPSVRSDCFPW